MFVYIVKKNRKAHTGPQGSGVSVPLAVGSGLLFIFLTINLPEASNALVC